MTDDKREEFADQANQLVAENRALRFKSNSDAEIIGLLKKQHQELSDAASEFMHKAQRKERALRSERDAYKVANVEIEALLLQVADLVTQALRKRVGDLTPEQIPDVRTDHVDDPRLPRLVLGPGRQMEPADDEESLRSLADKLLNPERPDITVSSRQEPLRRDIGGNGNGGSGRKA